MGELITRWLKIGIGFLLIWVLIYVWNMMGCRKVVEQEMHPTIPRDRFKVIYPGQFRPQHFNRTTDALFFEYLQAGQPQSSFAARVIALPGDRVRISEGEVFVNDQKVDQSFVAADCKSAETLAEIVVPKDCVYVLCDNRRSFGRYDSRGIGPVRVWAIDGKISQ
jgi:signal peptidase I